LVTLNISRYRKWATASKGQIKGSVEIENGGWHFSYLGGIDQIIQKVKNYSHQEFNTTENTDPEIMQKKIAAKIFCFRNKETKLEVIPIDDTFPLYLRSNIDKYKQFISETI
jgi:beta-1,4-mannosyl-glycoprotein beta-1,4-N-acetylglucosaminyltransferase